MSYVLIEQNLEEEDEPRFIYAELDSGRREVRRVEFYPNGLCFAYGGDYGREEALSPAPYPEDLRTLNRPGRSPPAPSLRPRFGRSGDRPRSGRTALWGCLPDEKKHLFCRGLLLGHGGPVSPPARRTGCHRRLCKRRHGQITPTMTMSAPAAPASGRRCQVAV